MKMKKRMKRTKLVIRISEMIFYLMIPFITIAMFVDLIKYGYGGDHYVIMWYSIILLLDIAVRYLAGKYLIKLKMIRKLKMYENNTINSSNPYEVPYLRVVR